MNTRRIDQRLFGAWLILLIAISAVMLTPVPVRAECTNCTTTVVGSEVIHTFTSGSGTFTPPAGVTSVRYLVVGGGGGGGGITNVNAAGAGGGGAGGYRAGTGFTVTPGTPYSITVGVGGTGAVCGTSCTAGTNGGSSTFATITAAGGGRGGFLGDSVGAAGGSGGGGRLGSSGGAGNTPSTTPSQGNNGGSGDGATATTAGAGGGGGASATGANGSGNVGGVGGAGISNDITGTAVTYAGGGGGGGYNNASGGAGGTGGGGSAPNSRGAGGNATPNTGSGGGGASGSDSGAGFNGGNGGSGIVVVRYTSTGRFAIATGNWNATSTWSAAGCTGPAGASVPAAGSDVTICNTRTVTLNTNTANLNSLTIQGTGVLNVGNSGTARTVTVSGNVDNAGTLRYNTAAAHVINIGGAFTNSGTFTSAAVGGAKSLTVGGLITNSGTFRFAGTGVMTVNANGGISNSNIFDVDTASNLTHVLNIGSNLVNNGTFNMRTDADSLVNVTFNGAAAQTLSGSSANSNFHNLILNNANGLTLSGSQDAIVNATLTLTNGRLTTNDNVVHVVSGNAVTGAGANNFVVGNLRKNFTTGSNVTRIFEVGTVAGGVRYAPVEIRLGTVTGAGALTVSTTAGDHPNIGSSTLDPGLSINRYWTIANNTVTFGASVDNRIIFTYVNPGDFDPGADFNNFYVGRYTAPTWTEIEPSARAATNATISAGDVLSGTIIGDYQIAERTALPTFACGVGEELASGLFGSYYDYTGESFPSPPPPTGTPTGTRVDGPIDFDWGSGSPGVPGIGTDFFAIRWDGAIHVTSSGSYQFQTVSDDGVRLWVNDVLVIDNWTDHAATTNTSGNVSLVAGQTYSIRLEYYENAGQAVIRLRWGPSGGPFVPIPAGPEPALGAGLYHCAAVPLPDPVAFYQMDEAAWTGTTNEVIDSSGNDRHGTAQGGADTSSAEPAIPGSPGTCGYGNFDGVNDYVQVPNLSNILNGTASLAFWIRTTQTGNDTAWQAPGVTGVEAVGSADDIFWGWLDASGRIGLSVGNTFGVDTRSTQPINDGTWHHVVLTRDHVAGTFKIYINGSLNQSGTIATGLIGTPFSSIGKIDNTAAGGSAPGQYFDGQLDEVRIYDQVLDDAQVTAIMAEVRPCVGDDDAVLFFTMDEESWDGTTGEVIDSSGNNHHGTARTAGSDNSFPTTTPAQVCNGGYFRGEGYSINQPPWWVQARHYVEVPNNPQLSPLRSTGAMSISGWFRAEDVNGTHTLVHKGQGGTTQEYRIALEDQRLHLTFWNANGGAVTLILNSPVISTNEWYFFGMVAERPSGNRLNAELFLFNENGTLLNSTSGTWNPFFGGGGGNYDDKPLTGNLIFGGTRFSAGDPTQFYDGILDEIRLHERTLTQSELQDLAAITRPCAEAFIDHIRIEHPGEGLTCAPVQVTVRACADAVCSSEVPEVVTTTLTPTGWLGGDTISFTGSTAALLAQTTAGMVTLSAVFTSPPPLGPTRCFVGMTETCELNVHDSGFVFSVPDHVADTEQVISVAAVRTNPDDPTDTCAPAFDGPKTVGFWYSHINTASPAPGTPAVNVNATAVGTASPGTPVNLNFDGSAVAEFTLRYADVGEMRLDMRYDGSGDEAGLIMLGNSTFITRPSHFRLNVPGNPEASSAGGGVFTRAGEDFDIEVSARNASDAITLNYGRELVAESVDLDMSLVAPVGGSAPALSGNFSAFGQDCAGSTAYGVACGSFNWPEVGIIQVEPRVADNDYLGTGNVVGNISNNIGRFIPHDFNVTLDNSPSFQPGCDGAFTYLDQAFDYADAPQVTITARNTFGTRTQNYDADFWRLSDFNETETHADALDDLPGAVVLDHGMAGHNAIDCSGGGCHGEATTTFHGPFSYMRNGAPQAPFAGGVDIEFSIIDADDVAYANNPYRIEHIGFDGSAEQRWGRLRLMNASGSELMDLSVPVLAEYYDEGYRLNSEDSCTVLTLSDDIRLSNPETEGGDPQPGTADMTVGGGSSSISPGDISLSGGTGQLVFSAPGAGNTGYIDITTLLSGGLGYLLSDWSGSGEPEDNPSARATFGIYSGQQQFIYIREPW